MATVNPENGTGFPAAIDAFATTATDTDLAGGDILDHAAAINAIEGALGVNPHSPKMTVAARLAALPPRGSGFPDVVAHAPLWAISTANGTLTVNRMYFMRVVIPRTGKLRDLNIFVLTASGNALGAVYDCGEASAGNRTRLWGGVSTALGVGNAWQSLGDPNLDVVEGQMVDLVFMADNATATFPRGGSPNGAFGQLPTNFATSPGGAPLKMCPIASPGSFAMPSSIAEASVTSSVQTYPLIARIS